MNIRFRPQDGRMLFNLEDASCLCAITVKPQSIPDYAGVGKADTGPDAFILPSGDPSRDGRKLSRAERHRRHDELIAEAEARASQADADAIAQTEDGAEDVEGAAEDTQEAYLPTEPAPQQSTQTESKETATGPTSAGTTQPVGELSPVDRLARLNVFLTRDRLNHVRKGHRAQGRIAAKSKFLPAHSTRAGLKALLARCLEGAAREGRLAGIIHGGENITLCNLGELAGYHHPGNRPTSWVKVVTVPYFNPETGVYEHYMVTFHPVLN